MDTLVPALIISFFITFSLIPLVIHVVTKRNILDEGGGRKIHKGSIPRFGGVAVFIGFISSLPIWLSISAIVSLKFIFVGILLIVFVGLRDDLLPISPLIKLIGQLVAGGIVTYFGGVKITSLHGLFGVYEINPLVSFVVTVFTIIVITNAFNLVDGVNGVAGNIAILSFTFFGIFFFATNSINLALMSVCMIGALIGFLKFNYTPARIFLGDTGSLFIGFVLAVATIKFIEINSLLVDTSFLKYNCVLAGASSIIFYPLVDTLRVFVFRMMQKRSPFAPDKSHIHHLILRIYNSHLKTTWVITVASLSLILITVIFRKQSDVLMLPLIIIISVIMLLIVDYALSKLFPKKTSKNKIFK